MMNEVNSNNPTPESVWAFLQASIEKSAKDIEKLESILQKSIEEADRRQAEAATEAKKRSASR
jgi:hypothetical protein